VGRPSPRKRRAVRGPQRGDAQAVALGDGDEPLDPSARTDHARDAGGDGVIERECASEQGAPREEDRDLIGDPAKLAGRALHGGRDEEGVREAAAPLGSGRPERRLGHPRGGRVDADDERARLTPGTRQDRPTVAGTEVEDDSVGASNPGSELADVHLVDAPADDAAHGRDSTLSDRRSGTGGGR
jgi:hypothetical protein